MNAHQTIEKMKKAHANRDTYWLKGKKKPNHSKLMTSKNNPNSMQIEYEGKLFDTLKDFSEFLGVSNYHSKKLINNNMARQIDQGERN